MLFSTSSFLFIYESSFNMVFCVLPFYKAPDFFFVPLPIPFSFEGSENIAVKEAETIRNGKYYVAARQTFAILELTEFKWGFFFMIFILIVVLFYAIIFFPHGYLLFLFFLNNSFKLHYISQNHSTKAFFIVHCI